MIVDISELLKENIEILPFELAYNENVIERDNFSIKLKSLLTVSGNVSYNDEIITVDGKISCLVDAQCSRCLENFNYHVNIDFSENFSKQDDSTDCYPISDNQIDLKNAVIDNIILSMPLKVLCSEDCKGLCPICGKNLNKGNCNCKKDDVDPRFAKLKDLFKAD